jgi:uncharacterized protein Yka (UPF0111/DUF47 family)
MFSLQKALGKEDRFFELLEASAAEAHSSAQALVRFFDKPNEAASLEEFKALRRKEKQINTRIVESLATQVTTVLEREDVEALSKALYKIPKTVEKMVERILLAPQFLSAVDLSEKIGMLERATKILLDMIGELKRGAVLEEVQRQNADLQRIEREVDEITTEWSRGLYEMKTDVGQALFLRDLYDLFEKVTDRCRDAGNVIVQIVLKGQ